jgi:hypothetical protein
MGDGGVLQPADVFDVADMPQAIDFLDCHGVLMFEDGGHREFLLAAGRVCESAGDSLPERHVVGSVAGVGAV